MSRPAGAALVIALAVAACGGRPPPPAVVANAAADPAPTDGPRRGRYVGTVVGYELHHGAAAGGAGALHLPDGLVRSSVVNLGDDDAHTVVVARAGGDLVVLLVTEGVVRDDVTFAGAAASGLDVVQECTEDVFFGLVDPAACTDSRGTVPATAAWNLGHASLELVAAPPACSCWFLEL